MHTLALALLLLLVDHVDAVRLSPSHGLQRSYVHFPVRGGLVRLSESPDEEVVEEDETPLPGASGPGRYDVSKLAGSSTEVGKITLDPVLSATTFVSRRFGLVGGLAVVALLAATEGREILGAFSDKGPVAGSGEVVTTSSGLQYIDQLVGTVGSAPMPGNVVGFNAVVSIGDKVLFDTSKDKPVAFKLGSRPFQNIVCEGVEEGLRGMKVGSKRTLLVPAALAPQGLQLPPGVPIKYEIEVTEVLQGYF